MLDDPPQDADNIASTVALGIPRATSAAEAPAHSASLKAEACLAAPKDTTRPSTATIEANFLILVIINLSFLIRALMISSTKLKLHAVIDTMFLYRTQHHNNLCLTKTLFEFL